MSVLRVSVPRAYAPLLQPARYKGAHGGRGSAKSHFFAERLILRCLERKTRAVCIREVQNTLRDSVRQLLVDKIVKFGLEDEFEVLEAEIRVRRNGGLIIFRGMQNYSAENIKSLEDFDVAWVEEAQTLTERSLRLLRPTIRKDGSELWFSWNPRYETDAVDKFLRQNPPPGAVVVSVNWDANPWFPKELRDEMSHDYATDPEMADHVWGGAYEVISAGAYFAKHLQALENAGRIGDFPPIDGLPVFTSWDLGVDDYTSIWFFQVTGLNSDEPRVRIIDFWESDGLGPQQIIPAALPEYVPDLQDRVESMLLLGRKSPFSYTRHFLPHDIKVREWGAGARARIQTLTGLGVPMDSIKVGSPQNDEDRINAIRELLPLCEFNATSRVRLGLTHLRRYSRRMNEQLGIYLGPLHDEHSHAADAFGEFAANCGLTLREHPRAVVEDDPVPEGHIRLPIPPAHGPRQYRRLPL